MCSQAIVFAAIGQCFSQCGIPWRVCSRPEDIFIARGDRQVSRFDLRTVCRILAGTGPGRCLAACFLLADFSLSQVVAAPDVYT